MELTSMISFKNQLILVIGDVMLDNYIDGDVKRISPEAPVPVLSVKSTKQHLGGAGNVVNNIISLGASVVLLSCWGADNAGDALSNLLYKTGVDTSFVRRYNNVTTIEKTRMVSRNHQLFRYDIEKIEPLCKEYMNFLLDKRSEFFKGITAVIVSDYGKGMITEKSAQLIIKEANKRQIPVIVDPKGSSYEKYKGATICTPNYKEFLEATGVSEDCSEQDVMTFGISLAKRHSFENLLITRSAKGMSLIHDSKRSDFPAVSQEVTDVTGAGDTVVAVFALGMGAGLSLSECCIMANNAAAIVISKFGAATVTPDELMHSNKLAESGLSIASELRRQGRSIVFTNGCFDIVHAGHVKSFEQAKAFGDVLIVGLNSDRSVRAIKGLTRPLVSQENRAKLLCALSCIDYVIIFDEDTPERLINEICPDVLVKGADWRGKIVVGQDVVEANGGKVELIELEQGLSTTSIIEKIKLS